MARPQTIHRLLGFGKPAETQARFLAEAFTATCLADELKNCLPPSHHLQKEPSPMLDTLVHRSIILDILASGDYTPEGIARYTQTPPDLIENIAAGFHAPASLPLFQRLVNLHKTVRPALYRAIRNNILQRLQQEEQGEKTATQESARPLSLTAK